jgi:nitrate/nitrite transporter NarK
MVGRFLVGTGATVTFIGTLKVAANWFPPSHFGTLAAVTATVGVVGALGGTAPLAGLVVLAGWRGAFATIAALTLVGAVACALLVREHPPGAAAAVTTAPDFAVVLRGLGRVLRTRHTWPPFLAFFFAYAALGNLLLWIIPYLRDIYGLSTTTAATYASAISFALLLSAPLTGYLSDQVLRRRKLPYTCSLAASSRSGSRSPSARAHFPCGAWPPCSSAWAQWAVRSCSRGHWDGK